MNLECQYKRVEFKTVRLGLPDGDVQASLVLAISMPGCGLRLIDTYLPDLLFGKGQNKFTTWSMWARSVDTIFCGNAFLRLKVRKPVKKNNRPNFKNADEPVPANHLLFFAICKKNPRLAAEICDKFIYDSISMARSSSRQIPGGILRVRRI